MQQLNRRKYADASQQPFNWDIQSDTLNSYVNTWAQVLAYARNVYAWEHEFSPPCPLTPDQQQAIKHIRDMDWSNATEQAKDAAVLDVVWAVGAQHIWKDVFASVLVSACAVLGVDARTISWRTAVGYEAKHFSAIIKIFLYMVYLRASTAIED